MFRLKRLLSSFRYALKGLVKIFKEEQNLRIQSAVGLFVFFIAVLLRVDRIELIFLIFSVSLVILMETINSAVERVADVLKPRISNYVKEIKDITAAAVMIASFVSVLVGILIFWPYLVR